MTLTPCKVLGCPPYALPEKHNRTSPSPKEKGEEKKKK